jgi:hypothetical protein
MGPADHDLSRAKFSARVGPRGARVPTSRLTVEELSMTRPPVRLRPQERQNCHLCHEAVR